MKNIGSMSPIKQILTQSLSRYATIAPKGIVLPHCCTPQNPLCVTIAAYHAARSRYVNRYPVCRSLDGTHAVDQTTKCLTCPEKRSCTPQIALEVTYRNVPLRFLLSYTSANNFLTLVRSFSAENQTLEGKLLSIKVTDRGRWGEPTFSIQ